MNARRGYGRVAVPGPTRGLVRASRLPEPPEGVGWIGAVIGAVVALGSSWYKHKREKDKKKRAIKLAAIEQAAMDTKIREAEAAIAATAPPSTLAARVVSSAALPSSAKPPTAPAAATSTHGRGLLVLGLAAGALVLLNRRKKHAR